LQQLDAVRDQVKPEVIKDKKFEILSKKVADAHANSIDELAGKLGKTAMQATAVTFTNPNLNGMFEPKAVATAFATAIGKVSQPVKGASGVFVVQPTNIQQPPVTTNFSAAAQQLEQQLQGKSRYSADVQKKLANISDTRSEFF
jgi:peptidyl-prolyl cis-trans isomerase D